MPILFAALAFVSGIVIIARRHPTEQIREHLAFYIGVFRPDPTDSTTLRDRGLSRTTRLLLVRYNTPSYGSVTAS